MVESLANDTTAVCVNLRSSKNIQKSMVVERTGKGVEIPVGDDTIGRVFDALGEPLDGKPPMAKDHLRKNIQDIGVGGSGFLASKPEVLETGIKVIDFFHTIC